MSRFPIHDELTAPEGSLPILKAAAGAAGGQLPNLVGVLAGSPAALRAYTRFRAELRATTLSRATTQRLALAVAHHHGSAPALALHRRTAARAGLGLDELRAAEAWSSADPREAALLRWLRAVVGAHGPIPLQLHEEVREAGWREDQLLEALAFASLETFAALVEVAGDVPVDGSTEASRLLDAA